MSRLVASLGGRRILDAEWVDRVRDSVHLWNAVPIALAALTLALGGFWLGGVVGGGTADAATHTVRLQGHVITVAGTRYVSTPAQTVLVKGKRVRLAAQTVPLPAAGRTTQLPGRTVLVSTTITDTSVGTVVRTVTVPAVTVTAPASTVTGPTTTVQDTVTVTVPVVSTVTVTIP
jgi:hypothetical protein